MNSRILFRLHSLVYFSLEDREPFGSYGGCYRASGKGRYSAECLLPWICTAVRCLCKSSGSCSFFVPFVAVSQGFTEISAANRESLNWTSGSVFWIKKPRFPLFLSHSSQKKKKIHKALESKILQKHTPKYLKSLFLKIENIKVLWKTASENNLKKYDFELNP